MICQIYFEVADWIPWWLSKVTNLIGLRGCFQSAKAFSQKSNSVGLAFLVTPMRAKAKNFSSCLVMEFHLVISTFPSWNSTVLCFNISKQYAKKPRKSSESQKQFDFCFCTILLRLVAKNTKSFLCSGGEIVFGRWDCVRVVRLCKNIA